MNLNQITIETPMLFGYYNNHFCCTSTKSCIKVIGFQPRRPKSPGNQPVFPGFAIRVSGCSAKALGSSCGLLRWEKSREFIDSAIHILVHIDFGEPVFCVDSER